MNEWRDCRSPMVRLQKMNSGGSESEDYTPTFQKTPAVFNNMFKKPARLLHAILIQNSFWAVLPKNHNPDSDISKISIRIQHLKKNHNLDLVPDLEISKITFRIQGPKSHNPQSWTWKGWSRGDLQYSMSIWGLLDLFSQKEFIYFCI